MTTPFGPTEPLAVENVQLDAKEGGGVGSFGRATTRTTDQGRPGGTLGL